MPQGGAAPGGERMPQPGVDVPDRRGRTGLDRTGRDLDRNPRVRVRDVRVLASNWYVTRTTAFDFQHADGTWTVEERETYDRGDGATILLRDGREVRLAGVIAANTLDGDAATAAQAKDTLHAAVAGKRLALYSPRGLSDRYGRAIAQVTVEGEQPGWLQANFVSAGMLRAAPEASEVACAASLLSLEAGARAARRGLWHDARFAVVRADDTKALTAAIGRFAVVEGIVRHVGETSNRTYLDYGRRYTQDFSIVIPRAARAEFAAAGVNLKELRGRRVRVRGVLFSSGGPAVEIRKPVSLEILKGGGA